ncbi:hypothetical protein SAMN04488038_105228 [Solimonas aquatica]|uniref:DUF2062 domain-containing protein n=1 Tax=Solimonas aquatica TaxID=489703 RepID=A0A1H9F245_9GAMM|nr:DUF2062 domain-containing protein [Solimonas aquatica]SEQ31985.1 hypothetical protein SAMN04488038_105228 [Solimonas aquatica]
MSDSNTEGFWQRRLIRPIVQQLRQGITPEQIALTLALAAVLGVFPVLGATTFLCGIAALLLRLNQPLIQVANYLLTPLHVALLLPFYRGGESLFGAAPVPLFSVGALIERFEASPLRFIADYGMVALYGIALWCLLAPLVAAPLYLGLRPLLRALARRAAA